MPNEASMGSQNVSVRVKVDAALDEIEDAIAWLHKRRDKIARAQADPDEARRAEIRKGVG
jgi:hypothetical protein